SLNDIPDVNQTGGVGATNLLRWVIPYTEIALVRAQDAAHQGQFLFSPDTIDRAEEFYQRVRTLPYVRRVPLQGFGEMRAALGGWLIPPSWIEVMPAWARAPLAGQSGWKWLALGVLLVMFSVVLWSAYRLSLGRSGQNPFRKSLAHLALPLF